MKKIRGGWAPEIHEQGDLRFFFHLSLHYITVFECAIALQDQPLPIAVRHFRAGVFERLDLPHQLVAHQQIVRVQVLKEYATGDRRSGVSGPACPAVCGAEQAHSGELPCDDLRAGIRRAIVDDDDLNEFPWVGLGLHAGEGLDDPPLGVEHGNDDTNELVHRLLPICLRWQSRGTTPAG